MNLTLSKIVKFTSCVNSKKNCVNFKICVFRKCCNYSVKYFNFCWCEVVGTSKQRLGLLSAILIPSWWLVSVAKATTRALVSVGIGSDVQITSTKICPVRRMTVDCVAILTVNDRTFEWLHVVRVS